MFLSRNISQRQGRRQLPVRFGGRDCGFLTLERLWRSGSCLKKSGSSPMKEAGLVCLGADGRGRMTIAPPQTKFESRADGMDEAVGEFLVESNEGLDRFDQ